MSVADALRRNIRSRRSQLRLSQAEVSARVWARTGFKVHASEISRYESGEVKPTIDKIEAIAAALACSAADLMTVDWELPPLPEGF